MGGYLGQHTGEGALSGAAKDIGGGAATGATVGSIFPGPGTAIGAGVGAVVGTIKSIFGHRSSCSDDQKQQRSQIADTIRQYLTPEDRQQLVQGMENNVAPTPEAMARFFMGGKDCKHKNVTPGDQQFLDRLPQLVEQRGKEQKQDEQQKKQQLPAVNASVLPQTTDLFPLSDDTKRFAAIGAGGLAFLATAIIITNKNNE